MPYGWDDAPAPVRERVGQVTAAFRELLGGDLIGVYLHGSLAMGCFNPRSSDIDLLVVCRSEPSIDTLRELARRLLVLSGNPWPLELSVLSEADLRPWRFPTPFRFHYGEEWRERYSRALAGEPWPEAPPTDPDLAAHITIVRHRGVVLLGPPAEEVFPEVPPGNYLTAIWDYDTRHAAPWLAEVPVYWVLNLCRVVAYVAEGRITSKEEGGRWALAKLPPEYPPVVAHALDCYRGEVQKPALPPGSVERFAAFMATEIEKKRMV